MRVPPSPFAANVMLPVLFSTSRLISEVELKSFGSYSSPPTAQSSSGEGLRVQPPPSAPIPVTHTQLNTVSWFLLYRQTLKFAYKTPFVFEGFSSQLVNAK